MNTVNPGDVGLIKTLRLLQPESTAETNFIFLHQVKNMIIATPNMVSLTTPCASVEHL
jgi:hypothetical protein